MPTEAIPDIPIPELRHGGDHFPVSSSSALEAIARDLEGEHVTFSYPRPSGITGQVFVTVRAGPFFDATYDESGGFPLSKLWGITPAELLALWQPS